MEVKGGLAQTYLDRKDGRLSPVPREGKAPVQEVVHREPDDVLSILPILTYHEGDVA